MGVCSSLWQSLGWQKMMVGVGTGGWDCGESEGQGESLGGTPRHGLFVKLGPGTLLASGESGFIYINTGGRGKSRVEAG